MFDIMMAFVVSLIIFVSGISFGLLFVVIKLAFGFHDDLRV